MGGESYIILSKEEIEALQAAKRNGEDLEAGIRKTALVLVGGFLAGQGERSKLYDPAFTTEFRVGVK